MGGWEDERAAGSEGSRVLYDRNTHRNVTESNSTDMFDGSVASARCLEVMCLAPVSMIWNARVDAPAAVLSPVHVSLRSAIA